MDKKDLLRQIPKIDEVLKDQRLFMFLKNTPRELVVDSARETIDLLREKIINSKVEDSVEINYDTILKNTVARIQGKKQKSLRTLINGTGTILHTNLGRARLSEEASKNILEAATGYSTLEYDLKKGSRGSRHDHIEGLIVKITGAEAAMVVNNNAAAVLLCLFVLAKGKEAIVSRGELVEIGGSFRIPEIMELGGAFLKEVGTTNKTKYDDYKYAIDPEKTGVILKVHTSNYKIVGFTAEVELERLVDLGEKADIPIIYDLGSGLLVNLKGYGIDEPTVQDSVKIGVDVITFSGDKLLGGPQAGIIVGKKKYIDEMREHPLARALRVDKLTLAALESTFRGYLDIENVFSTIPTLSMITAPMDEMRVKAIMLAEQVRRGTDAFDVEVMKSEGQIGGGSTPNQFIKSFAVSLRCSVCAVDRIERDLRSQPTPIIVRIQHDKILIDTRTVSDVEIDIIAKSLISLGNSYIERQNRDE